MEGLPLGQEIERKFLVAGSGWRARSRDCRRIRQAYLARTDAAVVRLRIVDGAEAFLTIKSSNPGMTRSEFEYAIPVKDAEAMLALRRGGVLEKERHRVPASDDHGGDLVWEVDVFHGAHEGLVLAEIELADESASFARPDWLGAEVTADPRYYNASLALEKASPPPG